MLEAFLSRKSLENWRSFFSNPHHQASERLDNLWLLSTPAFDAIRKGQVHFKVKTWVNNPDRTRKQTVSDIPPYLPISSEFYIDTN